MTEFNKGIFKAIKVQLLHSSMFRAIIYTIGHIFIASVCAIIIIDADFTLATIDAIVEPIVNGIWYYILDKSWSSKK